MTLPKRAVPKNAKERIIDAATTEFAGFGFHGARLARIAKRAKVSSQLLYHYFNSKQGLYHTILETSHSHIPFPRTLTGEFEAMGQWFQNTQSLQGDLHLRLVLWEALENKGGHYAGESFRREIISADINTFRVAQENGLLSSAFDPLFLYMTFTGLNALPKIFPQIPGVLGINPEDPQFLDHWHKHLLLVARAMGYNDSKSAEPGDTLSVYAQEANSALHEGKNTFTLEEVRALFDETIRRLAAQESGDGVGTVR